jgi:hypothetical protein
MSEEKEAAWYFTFCQKQTLLRNKYVKIFGTFLGAREIMFQNFGEKWGFQYSEEEFKGQVRKYSLGELK